MQRFGIRNYYAVKMAMFLDENTIGLVLNGQMISTDVVKEDLVLSKMDKNSIMSFIHFMTEEPKNIHLNEMMEINITRITDAEGLVDDNEIMLIEAIASLEHALDSISVMVSGFSQELITTSLTEAARNVSKNVSNEDLIVFFQEYDKEVILKLIQKAREANQNGAGETDESIKEKMIISKLKTKINESNISLITMNKLLSIDQYKTLPELQTLIDHN